MSQVFLYYSSQSTDMDNKPLHNEQSCVPAKLPTDRQVNLSYRLCGFQLSVTKISTRNSNFIIPEGVNLKFTRCIYTNTKKKRLSPLEPGYTASFKKRWNSLNKTKKEEKKM